MDQRTLIPHRKFYSKFTERSSIFAAVAIFAIPGGFFFQEAFESGTAWYSPCGERPKNQ